MVVDPLIPVFIRTGFALLLMLTAVHKLRDVGAFKGIVADYNIAPEKLVPVLSICLPIIEISIAGLLIFAPVFGVPGAVALLGFYGLIMAFNIARGRTHIDCGCSWGGAKSGFAVLHWEHVLRNLVLIAIVLAALIPAGSRQLGILDGMNLVFALGFGYVAVKAFGVLGAVRTRMREVGHV